MARTHLLALALFALTACGDPLRGVERLSDTEVTLEPQSAAALPTEAETASETGLLDRLLPASETPAAETPVLDGQGGGPIPPEAAAQAEPEPAPARRGLFASILGPAEAPAAPTPDTEVVAAAVPGTAPEVTATPEPAPEPTAAPPVRRSGFLGLFSGAGTRGAERTASLSPDASRGRDGAPAPRAAPVRTADALDVAPGAKLAFGQIARVCDVKRGDLGRKIETAGQRSNRFTLYDSDPRLKGPRTWYVTGFADGCPRQFTAALAIFGAPSMYENLRYILPASAYNYGETDKSYDRLKSRICGVSRGKPCGNRIDAMERSTVFISAYERIETNGRWSDILLHDGAVMAAAIKAP